MRVYDSLLPSNIGFVPVVAVIVVVLDVVVVPSTQRRKNLKALKTRSENTSTIHTTL